MINVSFEFFPPKSYLGFLKLLKTQKKLSAFSPRFVSVTQGNHNAKDQLDVVVGASKFFGSVAPHVLCSNNERGAFGWLSSCFRIDSKQLVVLRGDKETFHHQNYCGVGDAVNLVRTKYGDNFIVDVSFYPDSHPKSVTDISEAQSFTAKTKNGMNSAITQYFYNLDAFCYTMIKMHRLGVRSAITPGIMTSNSWGQLIRMARSCGSDVPLWVVRRLQNLRANEKLTQEFCTELTAQLCQNLINCGVNDLHFYTLNDHRLTSEVYGHIANEIPNDSQCLETNEVNNYYPLSFGEIQRR